MTLGTVLAAGACGGGTAPSAGPLLPDPGSSAFVLDRAASQNRQSLASFSQSTPAEPKTTRRKLQQLRARTTASRVWTQPDGDFVLDEAVRFDTSAHAAEFTRWYRSQLNAGSAGVFPMPDLADGYAYITGGNGRTSASSDVFVEGVAFTGATQVFIVETGGPNPASLAAAEALAGREAALAARSTRESS